MYWQFTQARHLLRTTALLLVTLSVGCGKDEGNRVSGMITFNGQPVPAGKIYFTPDTSKGNSGPTGYADITNGRYDTASETGKGIFHGAMIVAVEGIDPAAKPAGGGEGAEDVTSTVLFARYETTAEIAGGESTLDIEVPAEAAKGPKQPAAAAFISP